jgi:hypothetical protein
MSPRDRYNGGDVAQDPFPSVPTRNPVPERRPLGEAFTPVEPESVTGVIARRLVDQVGALVTRADQTSADLRALGDATVKGFNEIKVMLNLPPMRAESPSSAAVPVHARKSFGEFLKQQARETPGGPGVVQAPPEEIEQAAQSYFEQQMAIYENNKAAKEKVAALERRRNFWALTISASIAAVVGALAIYFVTKATEHEKGFSEGLRAAPTATVVVAAPPASAWAQSIEVTPLPTLSAAGVTPGAPHKPVPAPPVPAAAAPAH